MNARHRRSLLDLATVLTDAALGWTMKDDDLTSPAPAMHISGVDEASLPSARDHASSRDRDRSETGNTGNSTGQCLHNCGRDPFPVDLQPWEQTGNDTGNTGARAASGGDHSRMSPRVNAMAGAHSPWPSKSAANDTSSPVAVKVWSSVLQAAVWVVADDLPRGEWPTDAPVYTHAEVKMLRPRGRDEFAVVHAAKTLFDGRIIAVQPLDRLRSVSPARAAARPRPGGGWMGNGSVDRV
jgi:hypothetical protein